MRMVLSIHRTRNGFYMEDRSRGYATDTWVAGTIEGLLAEIDMALREGTDMEPAKAKGGDA